MNNKENENIWKPPIKESKNSFHDFDVVDKVTVLNIIQDSVLQHLKIIRMVSKHTVLKLFEKCSLKRNSKYKKSV